MGLVIITDENTLKRDNKIKHSDSCIVCVCSKNNPEINDVEAIFKSLEKVRTSGDNLVSADKNMCDYHAKKAQGLKIVLDQDHLMELDSTSVSSGANKLASASKITKEEYEKEVEIEDGKINL